MRIITGTARGRRLKQPKGRDIRPTTDQVKEAMFNICQNDIVGRRVLDLFGGTGQLGLEAKSRGAATVDIIDMDNAAVRLIRENAALTGLTVHVVRTEALAYLEHCPEYDLIFLDPPYDSGLVEKALKKMKMFDILATSGIIICETGIDTFPPPLEEPYKMLRSYRYGKVRLTTYTKK